MLWRVRRLQLDGHIAQQLAIQSVADLPRGYIRSLAAGHRRCVHAKNHRDGRLVDGNRRHRLGGLDAGDGLTNGDVFDAGEADDVPGRRLLDVDPFQSFEGKELGDLCLLDGTIELAHGDLIADSHFAIEHAPHGNATEVVAGIEIRDEHLQPTSWISLGRRHVIDDRFEERSQILTAIAG
jgi:hypothetical protein